DQYFSRGRRQKDAAVGDRWRDQLREPVAFAPCVAPDLMHREWIERAKDSEILPIPDGDRSRPVVVLARWESRLAARLDGGKHDPEAGSCRVDIHGNHSAGHAVESVVDIGRCERRACERRQIEFAVAPTESLRLILFAPQKHKALSVAEA